MRDARTADGVWLKDVETLVHPDASKETRWAVLEVHPLGAPFWVGWRKVGGNMAEFYSDAVETADGKFAMRVDDQPVIFVVRPMDGRTHLVLECRHLVKEDNERYRHLPRY